MAKKSMDPGEKDGNIGKAFAKVVDILAAVRLFFGEAKDSLLGHLEGAMRRAQVLFLLYLWVSVGVLLMLLGLFDLLIDQAGVPRWVVFLVGGLVVALTAVIGLQALRVGKRGK